ncbi:MAG: vitamin K epoxide reductase family protein [Candidatus Gracilibacteria bacterium]
MVTISIKEALNASQRRGRVLLKWVQFINLLGFAIAAYLTYLHFNPTQEAVCHINDYLNCEVANSSSYSTLWGIPVAMLGLAAYLLLFEMGRAILKEKKWIRPIGLRSVKGILVGMFLLAGAGTLFSLYLTYVEFFILGALCVFCLAQQILIFLEVLLLGRILILNNRSQ